jgi:hypothetical protein
MDFMPITETETISLDRLRRIASAEPPCITIVLPETEAGYARIAFKDALARVRAQLEARTPRGDVASLLDPVESEAARVLPTLTGGPATFVFLRSPDVLESFHARYVIGQPLAAVDEWFRLRPLLTIASKRFEFFVLVLSLNHTRIMKCTDESFEAVAFPRNAGTKAADFTPGATQASIRAETVRDEDHPDDHLRHFYREVDRDVNSLLKDGYPPLVVVGLEHEVDVFFRVTTYPACVKPGIRGLPDRLGSDEMYRQALALVQSVTFGKTRQALENFDRKVGTGHASLDVQKIAGAASEGRVEHLFLKENTAVRESSEAGADLLDIAAAQTLRHGGDVKVLPEAVMPGGVPVCAILRYA